MKKIIIKRIILLLSISIVVFIIYKGIISIVTPPYIVGFDHKKEFRNINDFIKSVDNTEFINGSCNFKLDSGWYYKLISNEKQTKNFYTIAKAFYGYDHKNIDFTLLISYKKTDTYLWNDFRYIFENQLKYDLDFLKLENTTILYSKGEFEDRTTCFAFIDGDGFYYYLELEKPSTSQSKLSIDKLFGSILKNIN